MSEQDTTPKFSNSDLRRLILEQLFWGMLAPLVPNVALMALIYNISASGFSLLLLIAIYWLAISLMISYVVAARAHFSQVEGLRRLSLTGGFLGTLLVILFAHLNWTIFATFQEEPVSAFLFIFLINFVGTSGALIGYHNKRLLHLFN